MGFSRQEYWSGLLCPPPGDLPILGIKPTSLTSPALAGGFFPLPPPGKPLIKILCHNDRSQLPTPLHFLSFSDPDFPVRWNRWVSLASCRGNQDLEMLQDPISGQAETTCFLMTTKPVITSISLKFEPLLLKGEAQEILTLFETHFMEKLLEPSQQPCDVGAFILIPLEHRQVETFPQGHTAPPFKPTSVLN